MPNKYKKECLYSLYDDAIIMGIDQTSMTRKKINRKMASESEELYGYIVHSEHSSTIKALATMLYQPAESPLQKQCLEQYENITGLELDQQLRLMLEKSLAEEECDDAAILLIKLRIGKDKMHKISSQKQIISNLWQLILRTMIKRINQMREMELGIGHDAQHTKTKKRNDKNHALGHSS